MVTEKTKKRFWSKVDKSAGPDRCWEWKGSRRPNGYGRFLFEGHRQGSHRVAWILTNGPIPEGFLVCHHCDNKLCCNPNHLFLGTTKDNMQDAVRKGRIATGDRHGWHTNPERVPRGERHWTHMHPERLARGKRNGAYTHPEKWLKGERHNKAKLKSEQVLSIREKRRSGIELGILAKEYGVSKTQICKIINSKSWKHLS